MCPRPPTSGDDPLPNNPLAALRALRDGLPDGPPAAEEPDRAKSPVEGGAEKLVVWRERKGHGGKTATRIQGLELNEAQRTALAKEVKRALGCGARFESDDLLLQGDLLERAAKWFEGRGRRVVRGN